MKNNVEKEAYALDRALVKLAREMERAFAAARDAEAASERLSSAVSSTVEELREHETPSRDVAAEALENVAQPDVEDLVGRLGEVRDDYLPAERKKLGAVVEAAKLASRAR